MYNSGIFYNSGAIFYDTRVKIVSISPYKFSTKHKNYILNNGSKTDKEISKLTNK